MAPLGIFGPRSGHQALFNDLCRFHDIDRKTKALLQSVMEKLRPERPGLIFVDSTWLRKAIESPDFAEQAEVLQELHQKWFGRS